MIITCPNCSTKLSLDDKLVKDKSVKIRCANCKEIFQAGPMGDAGDMGRDLDMDLDLPDLGDLESGLDMAESGPSRGDLDLDLGGLGDLEAGLDEEPEPAASPEPSLEGDDSLGDLGELESVDFATDEDTLGQGGADADLGELPDLASEVEQELGGLEEELGDLDLEAPEEPAAADAGGDLDLDLGDLGEDVTETADIPMASMPTEPDLDLDLGELETQAGEPMEDEFGGEAPSDLSLDLGDMPGGDEGPGLDATADDLDLGELDLSTEEEPAPKDPDEDTLDLDLGGAKPAGAAEPAGEDDLGALEDDLDLEPPMEAEAPATELGDEELAIDLDSFELTDEPGEEAAAGEPASEGGLDLDFDLEDTLDMDPAKREAMAAQAEADFEAPEELDLTEPGGMSPPTEEITPPDDLQQTVAIDQPFAETVEQARAEAETEIAPPEEEESFYEEEEEEEEYAAEEEEMMPPIPPAVGGGGRTALIAVLVILFVAAVGVMGYFIADSMGVFGDKPGTNVVQVDDTGILHIDVVETEGHLERNANTGAMVVIKGKVKNNYSEPRSLIQVYAELYNKKGEVVAEEWAFAGNDIENNEFRNLDENALVDMFANERGENDSNVSVPPGAELPFTVIFFQPPEDIDEFTIQPIGSEKGGAPAAKDGQIAG